MVNLACQIVEAEAGYSPLGSLCCALVKRAALNAEVADLKGQKKRLRLSGHRSPKETLYFERSARAMARWAKRWEEEKHDEVVAILFHDVDTNNSSGRGEWNAKWDAMLLGFRHESFSRGVPMIPKPTSEAWILCALKSNPYERCQALEERSGSPKAKSPLKLELKALLGEKPTREMLCRLVEEGRIDSGKIDMPSFNAFRDRLKEVMRGIGTNGVKGA